MLEGMAQVGVSASARLTFAGAREQDATLQAMGAIDHADMDLPVDHCRLQTRLEVNFKARCCWQS